MAANYRKFKIHGKTRTGASKKKEAQAEAPQAGIAIPAAGPQKFSPADQEVIDKINELHVFMTQRGTPYIAVARCPDSGFPAGKFSMNHEHNKPEQTHRNAEWIFMHLGDMIKQATNGIVRIFRSY